MVRFENAFTDFNSFLVLGNEVVVTFGKGFFKTFVQHFRCYEGFHSEETAEHDHIEQLSDTEFVGFVSGSNLVDVDVLTCRVVGLTSLSCIMPA